MVRKKILYIVSNLRRTGPINQLFNIIINLNEFDCKVLTLSAEPTDLKNSRLNDYKMKGIHVDSLSLTRVGSLFGGKSKLNDYIKNYGPDIIQTQGIRADGFIHSLKLETPWITTSRNYPTEDYPSKFGFFKGWLMAFKHMQILAKCENLVSCSSSIANKLKSSNINSIVITNGVREADIEIINKKIGLPIKFITIGSLIKRKNMEFIVSFAKELAKLGTEFKIVVLGEGPLMQELLNSSPDNMEFKGNVDNVSDYLMDSDFFISSSFSEGLPNTVLEAISYGLPVILSDIPPHKEITKNLNTNSYIHFSLSSSPTTLAYNVYEYLPILELSSNKELSCKAQNMFGAEAMSKNYQKLYKECISGSKL